MKSAKPDNDRRPALAIEPRPGQESVWDYPRPPAIKVDSRAIVVRDGSDVIARTTRSYKVMETASPPTFYIPRADVNMDLLTPVDDQSYCEWKGTAAYFALAGGQDLPVGWSYERPRPRFDVIKNCIAFYPGRVDCSIGDEPVQAQAGRFYGGWITAEIVGPFKGDPGTGHW